MKRVKTTGPARMRELGYKSVTVWLDKLDAEAVEKAAERLGVPVASFVRQAAVLLASYGQTWEDPRTGVMAESKVRRR
jgi:hypothetical protein